MQSQSYSAYPENPSDIFEQAPVIYAGFWDRFGAAFIDGLILMIPNCLIELAFGNVSIIFSTILVWLYSALQESGPNQATIGKKAMGLKVTTTDGQPVSFGQATGRYFGKYISMLILFIGYFMMLWDDKKQTLHDKMAGTLVIKW